MSIGRGPQVVYLNDGAQLASRGAYGRTMRENVAFKELLEGLGTASDGYTVDGKTRTGLEAEDALYGRQQLSETSFVNVIGWGAIGDGVHDCTQAIRDAVAALGGQPGVIYFPPGRYVVSGSPVVLHSGVRVTGAGQGVSIILPTVMTGDDFVTGNTGIVFCNTLLASLGFNTQVPTTPANQTDHDIYVDNLGFDFTGVSISSSATCFLLARDIIIERVSCYRPPTTQGYECFKFIGCDNFIVTGCFAAGTANAVDAWKACTRAKIANCSFGSRVGGSNGGVINWNAKGSWVNDFGVADDLQIENVTIYLYDGCEAIFLDPVGGGSSTQNVLISNVHISARSNTTNNGILCRGRANRVKLRGVTFSAVPGADLRPFNIMGLANPNPLTQASLVTTASGSNIIQVSWPGGVNTGPGAYLRISAGGSTTNPLVGNGLSLAGYYPITGISGPVIDGGVSGSTAGDLLTVMIPGQVATASGIIAASTRIEGYYGHPHYFDFESITFDGVKARGGDLLAVTGDNFRITGVTVTNNFNGAAAGYRSIVGLGNAPHLEGDIPLPSNISDILGPPGALALQAGWLGDNIVTWDPSSIRPAFGETKVGMFTPVLAFGGDSTGIVYKEATGSYARNDPLVYFSLNVSITSKGSAVGAATIGGLPFNPNSWGGQARGTLTANFGNSLMVSPSTTTTPIVYLRTVSALTYTITNGGSGGATGIYPLTLSGGTGSGGAANFRVLGTDAVADLTFVAGSGGTDGRYPLVFTAAIGGGATGDILVTGGKITQARLVNFGSDYTVMPVVSFTVPGLVGASVTAVPGTGSVVTISIQSRGSYTVAPTATAVAPGLTGAVITAAVNTTGTAAPQEIIGKIQPGGSRVMTLALDGDALGMALTAGEFTNTAQLSMSGWYMTDR